MDTRTLRLLEYEKVQEMLRRHAASALGKEVVDRMRPAREITAIRQRLAETTEAVRLLEQADAPLGGLHDVRDAVRRAEKQGALAAAELLDIAETAAAFRRMAHYLGRGGNEPLLAAQARSLRDFTTLEEMIDQAITDTAEVRDAASPELQRARRRVRALHEEIQRDLQRVLTAAETAGMLQDPLITQRNGRFCVPVRTEARNTFKGIVHDLSASGQTVFMEPLSVVELGNDLREAERRQEEEVQRVLAQLSAKVGHVAVPYLDSLAAAARLDAIFARGLLARALDAVEPVMNTDGQVDLRQARHPLLGAGAVPIDIRLGDEGTSTLLITGPNTGGKTVTLKTVGLLTLMAQSGLHVPAQAGTHLAVFHDIFADIGDEQSIEQSLSTFSGHMTQIVQIIAQASTGTLVLLDEIGAGTDPTEGAALGKAILLELHERGCRTIATTHYGELKIFAQSTTGFLNASVEFDLASLRPTYRVLTGLPGSSNALLISQRLGLPKAIVARARTLMGEAPQAMEQVLKQAEGARRALDRERTSAAHERRQAEAHAARLAREVQEFEEKRAPALAKAREQAREIVQQTRLEANALLEELREAIREARRQQQAAPSLSATPRRTHAHATLEGLAERVEAALPAPDAPPPPERPPAPDSVTAGQSVFVRSLGHRGIVLESGQGDAEVEVQVGLMRVRVPLSDLEVRTATPKREPVAPPEPAREVATELHLLGQRADDAAMQLDEFLYDALGQGVARVRIVHGHGTGALRKRVREVLSQHPAVRAHRPGERQEGGAGVTVAELGLAD